MRTVLQRLRAEVRSDRDAVARWLDELAAIDLGSEADRGDLARAAWALHHAYSGVEAILGRTMRTIEGSLPEGPDFHKELLDAAALDLDEIRPQILSRGTVIQLHDLRAFRHFVRHAYAVDLDAERLADLQRRSIALRDALDADLDRLDAWLVELSMRLGGDESG